MRAKDVVEMVKGKNKVVIENLPIEFGREEVEKLKEMPEMKNFRIQFTHKTVHEDSVQKVDFFEGMGCFGIQTVEDKETVSDVSMDGYGLFSTKEKAVEAVKILHGENFDEEKMVIRKKKAVNVENSGQLYIVYEDPHRTSKGGRMGGGWD